MPALNSVPQQVPAYELRFMSLFHEGRGLSFPCDERGEVVMDTLSAKALNNYLYARAVVGAEYATPIIQLSDERF